MNSLVSRLYVVIAAEISTAELCGALLVSLLALAAALTALAFLLVACNTPAPASISKIAIIE